MDEFIHALAHDLRSPLVTSLSFIELLRADLPDDCQPTVADSLSRLERLQKRMVRMVDEVLNLSRMVRAEAKIEAVETSLLVAEAWKELGERTDLKGLRLHVQDHMPCLRLDKGRMRQLFNHLLSNAVTYAASPQAPDIWVGAALVEAEVRFFVRDQGPGIEPNFHQQIFGLFNRLVTTPEGTGVGLTVVQQVATLHGGRAWVDSDAGKGATFWVALPAATLEPTSKDLSD